MKKIFTFFFIFTTFLCFSQNIEWKVIRDSNVYKDETGFSKYSLFKVLKKGSLINGSKTSVYSYNSPEYAYLIAFDGDYYTDAEAVVPNGTQELLNEAILTPALTRQGKALFGSNYLEIIKTKNRESAQQVVPKGIDWYVENMDEYSGPWWNPSFTSINETYIFQTILNVDTFFNFATFYITDIKRKGKGYELQALCDSWYVDDTVIPENEQPQKGSKVSLSLFSDGGYIDIFYKDTWLIGSYAVVNKEFGTIFEQFLKTNTCDLSKVTFPRRADKNHSVGSTCIVAESLRLRKEENTTSATIQTMQPGTQVQIQQLGKKQTIDGITANWVQVQLGDGTKGWCFGGYLVEK